MTYKQIQKEYRRLHVKTIKTCWIADVKRELGLTKFVAHNRIDRYSVKYPCKDPEVRKDILKIIKNLS